MSKCRLQDKEKKGIEEGGFNFGKSKITSKHEIVRRGKDVDVKVDSLKLGKDDQLKVVVVCKLYMVSSRNSVIFIQSVAD